MTVKMMRMPTNRTLTVANALCAYCGTELTTKNRNRDHVVARKFVPEGTLHDSCNVGVWACKPCNNHKSKLEDDISAITMMPGPDGNLARDDERLRRTVERKLKGAVSQATRKRVGESHTRMNISMPFGEAKFTFGFTGAPVIDNDRAGTLAWAQLQGLWFFQTYKADIRSGRFLDRRHFTLCGAFSRFDWGNARILSFADQIEAWDHQHFSVLADGYFRAIVKAAPDGQTLAWATEWNDSFRCFGYWCQTDSWKQYADGLEVLKPDFSTGDTTNGFSYREEKRLTDDMKDSLFSEPPGFDDMPFHESND